MYLSLTGCIWSVGRKDSQAQDDDKPAASGGWQLLHLLLLFFPFPPPAPGSRARAQPRSAPWAELPGRVRGGWGSWPFPHRGRAALRTVRSGGSQVAAAAAVFTAAVCRQKENGGSGGAVV